MPMNEVQLTIEDAIRDRKRQERAEARSAKEQSKARKQATAGAPLFEEEASEVRHG